MLAMSSFCPAMSRSIRSAMSLKARVRSASSSAFESRRPNQRRLVRIGTRAVRSPAPSRRAASVSRSTGREMRRARMAARKANSTRSNVRMVAGRVRARRRERRCAELSRVPMTAPDFGSRTGVATDHSGFGCTMRRPVRTWASSSGVKPGRSLPAETSTRPWMSRATRSSSSSSWICWTRRARAGGSRNTSATREAMWREMRPEDSCTKAPRAVQAKTTLETTATTRSTPRKWRSMRAKSRPMSVWGAGEEVAHAAHRLDEARFLGIGLELGADLRDVHVDGAVEGLRMPLERVEDLLAGQHAAGGPGEGGQELELVVGEDPPLARHRDLARGEVELELADPQPRGWMRGGRAPQESADAGEELPWIERLGEIVVGAHLEPHHLVHIFALGGEHDHGQGGTVGEGADPAAYLEAVHAGEHDVEEHDVGPALVEDGETPRAVARQGHVDLVLAQVFRHEGAEAGIVVDQQGGGAARHGSYRITPPPIQCVARVKKCKGGPARVLARDGPAQYYLTGYKSMATVTLLRSRPRPHHVARHP